MLSRGSQWHRWDPHIHSPGTVLNDQFNDDDAWLRYLEALETADPPIRAIGVTDYYLTDNYERARRFKDNGRLPGVDFIFPNVEMRLTVAGRSGFINVHLLVNPLDSDHLNQISRIFSRLTFTAFKDQFNCTADDLIRLGRLANPDIEDDRVTLAKGATQFKVDFYQLRSVLRDSGWAKDNILVAVAGGSGDGTSGLREPADATLRQEIERFAHIIFSSSSAQREFWLGERSVTPEALTERYGGQKPCLHGSDAHSTSAVGNPDEDRYSWIKGDLGFEGLRQACIDPAARAYVGPEPPPTTMPSQVISSVTVENAQWMGTSYIPLNPGLVTVIGARGSGKTALAEMIAAGCDAVSSMIWDGHDGHRSSFLARALELLGDETVQLEWGGGEHVARRLDGHDSNGVASFDRARYLSQQFVEDLCSSNGPTDGLIEEIERVVFEAHPTEARDGALSFTELLTSRTLSFRHSRSREAEAIQHISECISEEFEKERQVSSLERMVAQKTKQIEGYKADLSKLVISGSDDQLSRHQELQSVALSRRMRVEGFKERRRTFERLQHEVDGVRTTVAPEMLTTVTSTPFKWWIE